MWSMTTKLYTKYIDVEEQVWVGGFIDVGSLGLSRIWVWTLLCKPIWGLMAIISCRSFFFFFSLSLIFFIYFERLVEWVGLTWFSVCWMGLTNLDVWILLLMVVAWACGVQIVWFEASDDWVHNGWLVRLCDLRLLMTEVTMGACWIVDCHRWWVCGGFRGLGSRVIVDWL